MSQLSFDVIKRVWPKRGLVTLFKKYSRKLLIKLGIWGAPPPQEKEKITLKRAQNGTFCHRFQTVIDINFKFARLHIRMKKLVFYTVSHMSTTHDMTACGAKGLHVT